MKNILLKIHNWLLPKREPMQFSPYVWLIYLGVFFTSAWYSQLEIGQIAQVGLGTLVFLVSYFHAYRAKFRVLWVDIFIICAVATWMVTITPGASVFFVYAGAFCCRMGQPRYGFAMLLSILFYIAILTYLKSYPGYFYIPATLFTLIIGGINIYQAEIEKKRQQIELSQQELRALATTAERERIARDLHDTMGHTLSLLSRKAELAKTLFDHDINLAKQHVEDIEQISRDGLKQIREVVTGYRTNDIVAELAHAKYVLESNDVQFQYVIRQDSNEKESGQIPEVSEPVNKELAIILRELVTNVLKHANASRVFADILHTRRSIHLEFKDNGVGVTQSQSLLSLDNKGFGLKGIKERVSELDGVMQVTVAANVSNKEQWPGLSIHIQVPARD